ncbi:DNA-directed RNA polymerase subunit alpha [Candidatus Woesebacteria bacterium CG22_combo_CG10-13_8_21_14_all_39_10]|uniref:DNA-directed RNA polymerase subunit alpha n=1 Tax=Candidatus Woesebacteria bacterium CG22_combo_CG10-13_8_21_14_all_39_10 TaxID=1975059 RepID=A0A2H0BJ25_9BACT|nr:MAG: DNA-directed RNA polymerase subunit alpha [Candidatus Woesebacteria bacterium CG22_combo_CG10-13_8_21_14_all_39_10]
MSFTQGKGRIPKLGGEYTMSVPLFEIKEEKKEKNYAKFAITPLERGYGDTLGNALRRVLLTSLPGAAITSVKLAGVRHQFSTLKGMKEDVVEFLLNLKKVRFSYSGEKPAKASLSVKSAGEVKAKDIKAPANVKIANPEFVLAVINKGSKLEADMEIEAGIGYSPADERSSGEIGLIPLDASFSPVVRVNYKVEETRVGRLTNYDKLNFEIWTDGTVDPKEALLSGAKILISHLNQIVNPKVALKEEKVVDTSLGITGKLSVEEIGLPTRVANALSKAGYETVEELFAAKKEDLAKVRNLGEKSLKIIKAALGQKGVTWEVI